MNPTVFLSLATKALAEASKNVITENQLSKVEDTIIGCSIAAAIAGVGSGWLPGAGSVVASAAWVAAIWTMYVKINKNLNISIKDNILKSLASAILTNIIATAGAVILALIAAGILSFIPGLGTVGAIAIDGMLGYITVFASGVIYIKLLTKVMKAKGSFDFSDTKEELEELAKGVVDESNVKEILKEAKQSFKDQKKSGAFDKKKDE